MTSAVTGTEDKTEQEMIEREYKPASTGELKERVEGQLELLWEVGKVKSAF